MPGDKPAGGGSTGWGNTGWNSGGSSGSSGSSGGSSGGSTSTQTTQVQKKDQQPLEVGPLLNPKTGELLWQGDPEFTYYASKEGSAVEVFHGGHLIPTASGVADVVVEGKPYFGVDTASGDWFPIYSEGGKIYKGDPMLVTANAAVSNVVSKPDNIGDHPLLAVSDALKDTLILPPAPSGLGAMPSDFFKILGNKSVEDYTQQATENQQSILVKGPSGSFAGFEPSDKGVRLYYQPPIEKQNVQYVDSVLPGGGTRYSIFVNGKEASSIDVAPEVNSLEKIFPETTAVGKTIDSLLGTGFAGNVAKSSMWWLTAPTDVAVLLGTRGTDVLSEVYRTANPIGYYLTGRSQEKDFNKYMESYVEEKIPGVENLAITGGIMALSYGGGLALEAAGVTGVSAALGRMALFGGQIMVVAAVTHQDMISAAGTLAGAGLGGAMILAPLTLPKEILKPTEAIEPQVKVSLLDEVSGRAEIVGYSSEPITSDAAAGISRGGAYFEMNPLKVTGVRELVIPESELPEGLSETYGKASMNVVYDEASGIWKIAGGEGSRGIITTGGTGIFTLDIEPKIESYFDITSGETINILNPRSNIDPLYGKDIKVTDLLLNPAEVPEFDVENIKFSTGASLLEFSTDIKLKIEAEDILQLPDLSKPLSRADLAVRGDLGIQDIAYIKYPQGSDLELGMKQVFPNLAGRTIGSLAGGEEGLGGLDRLGYIKLPQVAEELPYYNLEKMVKPSGNAEYSDVFKNVGNLPRIDLGDVGGEVGPLDIRNVEFYKTYDVRLSNIYDIMGTGKTTGGLNELGKYWGEKAEMEKFASIDEALSPRNLGSWVLEGGQNAELGMRNLFSDEGAQLQRTLGAAEKLKYSDVIVGITKLPEELPNGEAATAKAYGIGPAIFAYTVPQGSPASLEALTSEVRTKYGGAAANRFFYPGKEDSLLFSFENAKLFDVSKLSSQAEIELQRSTQTSQQNNILQVSNWINQDVGRTQRDIEKVKIDLPVVDILTTRETEKTDLLTSQRTGQGQLMRMLTGGPERPGSSWEFFPGPPGGGGGGGGGSLMSAAVGGLMGRRWRGKEKKSRISPRSDILSVELTELMTGGLAHSPSEKTSMKYFEKNLGAYIPTAEMLGGSKKGKKSKGGITPW